MAVIFAIIWAAGAVLLLSRTVLQNIFFCRCLRGRRRVDDPRLLGIFRDSKSLMGVRAAVRLVETGAVKSPALYGVFRPRLLLPLGLAGNFSASELRLVLLHELAHVRRLDMLVQWLVVIFQILHWFNPLLWLAFRRLAADRELACDELALSVVGEGEGRAYG